MVGRSRRRAGRRAARYELVTNAIDHATTAEPGAAAVLVLDMTEQDGRLRIALTDGSTIPPIVRALDPAAARGRGMQMIVALAVRWGYDELPHGKRVWFELDAPTR